MLNNCRRDRANVRGLRAELSMCFFASCLPPPVLRGNGSPGTSLSPSVHIVRAFGLDARLRSTHARRRRQRHQGKAFVAELALVDSGQSSKAAPQNAPSLRVSINTFPLRGLLASGSGAVEIAVQGLADDITSLACSLSLLPHSETYSTLCRRSTHHKAMLCAPQIDESHASWVLEPAIVECSMVVPRAWPPASSSPPHDADVDEAGMSVRVFHAGCR
jgi:hypothetical protein